MGNADERLSVTSEASVAISGASGVFEFKEDPTAGRENLFAAR